ncbi:MAG: hypothetical protein FJ100_23395, partial [Deltaproteobacteria bacterium]|nr:hypothetical protein [Deltaproteobacteria bacterium]
DIVAGLRTLAAIGACWLDRAPKGNLHDRKQRQQLNEVLGLLCQMAEHQRQVAEDLAFVQFRDELAVLIPTKARAKLLSKLVELGHAPEFKVIPPGVHFDEVSIRIAQRRVEAAEKAPETPEHDRRVLADLLAEIAACTGRAFDPVPMISLVASRSPHAGAYRSREGLDKGHGDGRQPSAPPLGHGVRRAAVSPSWQSSTLIKLTPEAQAAADPDVEHPRSYSRYDPLAGGILSGVANVRRLCPWLNGLTLQEADAIALADEIRYYNSLDELKAITPPQMSAVAAILVIRARCGCDDGVDAQAIGSRGLEGVFTDNQKQVRTLTQRLNRALADKRHEDETHLQEVDLGQYFCARAKNRSSLGGQDRAAASTRLLHEAANVTKGQPVALDGAPDAEYAAAANRALAAARLSEEVAFWARAARGAGTVRKRTGP